MLALAGAVALALGAGSATAAAGQTRTTQGTPCWVLINDWYDAGSTGSTRSTAIGTRKHLPADVDTYSSARDDIRQALSDRAGRRRRRGQRGLERRLRLGHGRRRHGRRRQRRRLGWRLGSRTDQRRHRRDEAVNADSFPVPLIVLAGVVLC
jgi:hypothetical protein